MKHTLSDLFRLLRTEGSFVQNSAMMFTTSGVSIAVQFIFFPILSRIYSPEAYGIFGVFNFYVTLLGTALPLGYNQAFVLPSSDRHFSALLRLTLYICAGISLVVFIVSLLAGPPLLRLLSHQEVGNWVYLIAPVAFLMALDRIAGDWAIRNKEFRRQMVWSTSTTIVVKSFNTAWGSWVSASAGGLILTTLLQHLLRWLLYARFVLVDFRLRMKERFSWSELRSVAIEYKEFPIYIFWGNFIQTFSTNLPSALLPVLGYGLNTVGFYAYAVILLDLPVRLLGAGISNVYLQKSAEVVRDRAHELGGLTWRLFRNIAALCVVFCVGLAITGEHLYGFFFGEPWREAGRAAEWLVIYYFFRMISAPLMALFNTLRREQEFFWFQVALAAVRVVALIGGSCWTSDFILLMAVFSIANGVVFAIMCVRVLHLVGIPWLRSASFLFLLSAAGLILVALVRS